MRSEGTSTIRALREILGSGVLSLKPATTRVGADAWFPYYAGYSSDFVHRSLRALGAIPGWCVLDPWNGAGTTTAVADHMGCDAIGYDVNPVAALVAAARLTRGEDASHCSGLAAEFLTVASRGGKDRHLDRPDDPLRAWLSPRLVRRYREIEAAVMALLGSRRGVPIDLSLATPPPFAAFFLLCLTRAAKSFACLKESSNPTWTTAQSRGDARAETLDCAFLANVRAWGHDAETAGENRSSPRRTVSTVCMGDARALPLEDEVVDAVITSPPYCTRIDYFRATTFELAALGIRPDGDRFRDLRLGAMGTNLMRANGLPEIASQPVKIRRLLSAISEHPSKDSDNYYVRHFAQYFDDARRSLVEIRRVLKPQRTALLVVQSSYYKDIPVPLGDLFAALGVSLGFRSQVVLQVPVKRFLSSINARASKHILDRHYTEDVVALQRVA